MKKIIYVAPHLSTGGLPQYLYKKIELLKGKLEIYCVEYNDITGGQLIVQKDRIKSVLDSNHFITLGNDKSELLRLIKKVGPDYIHLEEIPEDGGWGWEKGSLDEIYSLNRSYKIFETSHDSSFDPDNKKIYFPDAFFFVSKWQIDQYKNINVPKYLAEYPIEYQERPDRDSSLKELGLDPSKKHVLNVGLFTPRKNQGEIFELARNFGNDVQFHFLGNQAGNFESYWKPLMATKPKNCIYWGERNDADRFYKCMDLFLFTSRGNPGNKETMPLVLREALGWHIPIAMYNLDVYQNYFNKFGIVNYLVNDSLKNIDMIKNILGCVIKAQPQIEYFSSSFDREKNVIYFEVINEHPTLKKFNYRLRDFVNGLTFQPIGRDYDFKQGINFNVGPNARNDDHNGLILELFDADENIIETHTYESYGKIKGSWDPLRYPKTELWINNKLVKLHSHPNDHSSFWSYFECVLRGDYKGIESGDIIVDVGANLGFFSLSAIKQGAAKSYAIEPFPETFEYLTKNVEGLPIIPINCGIGNVEKETMFVGGEVTSITRSAELEEKQNDGFYGINKKFTKVKLKPFNQIIIEQNIQFIDYLKIDCEGGEEDLFKTIDPDFLKYRIKKITGEFHLLLIGMEGYLKIKHQLIEAGFDYQDNYTEGSEMVIFYAKRKPKIKLVHIINNPDGEREKLSTESLSKLTEYGIEYERHITPLYTEKPPAENCNRPSQVSSIPGDYLLSPGHYGCYLGHKDAVCNTYGDFDGLLVSECDAILQIPAKEMAEKIEQTYFDNIKNDLILTSYGKSLPGYPHTHVSGDLFWSQKIVEAHLYLISRPYLGTLKELFVTKPWDVSDLWYDTFLSSYKRGIYKKPYALQARGESYLDKTYKDGYIIHDHSVIYNPDSIDDDITVIIQTCDKYRNFWNGWYMAWKNNWNWNLKWPIVFCNEELDLPFNDSRISQIKSPLSLDKNGFSDRLKDILEKVKTKYVLYIQDDMWLTNSVNFSTFKEAIYKVQYNDWNCLRLHEKIWLNYTMDKTSHFVNEKRVLKMKSTSEWLLTHNAAIWNKEFLMESILPNEDPWTNEVEGGVRISKKYTDPKIYHLNERWYYQPGASQNGNINPFMEQYQRYLQYSEDLKKEMDI